MWGAGGGTEGGGAVGRARDPPPRLRSPPEASGHPRPSPCGFSRSGKVREGSTNTDTTGELLSAMGIVPEADRVRAPPSPPLPVRSRAIGPGPNRFPADYAPAVNSDERPSSLGAGALRALAERHRIRPKPTLGQN